MTQAVTTLTGADYGYAARAKAPVPHCPVCGASNPSLPAMARWSIQVGVSVCDCGLAYLNPCMTASEYAEFYAHWYRPLVEAYLPPSARAIPRLVGVACYGDAIGRLIRPSITPGGALLDVGGSTGAVATELGKVVQAETVMVIDPNPTELAEAAALGCRTRLGTCENQAPSAEQYHGILCARTIDHVRDPMTALRWMRSVLAPGGWLWIDMVDAARIRALWPLSAWRIDHPLYWSRKSLTRALDQTGWSVVDVWHATDVSHHLGFLCKGAEREWL